VDEQNGIILNSLIRMKVVNVAVAKALRFNDL